MKALVILRHSWSPFLPLTCLYGKNEPLGGLLMYFLEKKLLTDYLGKSHDHDHQWADLSWSDYHKIKENVNIMLLNLCLFTFYSVHANESTWHWL